MLKASGIEKDIAVIGMSSFFAKAANLDEYWKNIVEEINCITEVPADRWKINDYYSSNRDEPDKTYSKVGGFIPDINFNPLEFGLPPNIIELTDSSQLLSLVAARAALDDAGYWQSEKFNKEVRQRTGVVLGVGGGQKLLTTLASRLQYPVWEKTLRAYGIPESDLAVVIDHIKSAYTKWEENSFPGLLGNVIAGRITNRFDLGGTNCVVDAACATALSAIKMAVMELQTGHVDMIITGGVDTDNSPVMYLSFSKTPAFSPKNQIRPFDDGSDGIVIGEGIGLVVLKRLSDAVRDGDKIYSVIKGIGSSSDGKNKSIYAPQSSGQSLALKRAYDQAGYSMTTVGLIECHGTGTSTGDPSEFDSLKIELADQSAEKQSIALGSVKSQIGHTKSAAGAAGFIKASLALYNKILPGTINVTLPNRKFDIEHSPFYINSHTRPWIKPLHAPRRASVSAFGFGGTNFHVALEEYQPDHAAPYRSYTSSYAVVLTADSRNALIQKAGELLNQLNEPNGKEILAGISDNALKTILKNNQPALGFVAVDTQEAIAKLSAAMQYIGSTITDPVFEHPKGFYYSENDLIKGGKTAALFAGQGSQYVNMATDMACLFPPFREVLGRLDELFVNSAEQPLSKIIYPVPAFNEEKKAQQQQQLTQTQYAQPAIGAISVAFYKLLKQCGFSPDMVAGHSFGELTALWASGVITEEDYLLLAKERGRCMSAGAGKDGGAMLAVSAAPERIKEIIAGFSNLVIANINSGSQVVVGGDTKEIEAALAEFQHLGISAVKLPVSAAFHTSFVEHAAGPFAEVTARAKFKLPVIPVYSNTAAAQYPQSIDAIKEIIASHMLKPVLFKDEIEQMYNDNARVFVEFGPKGILTNLVKKILNGREFIAIAINPSEEKGSEYQFKEAVVKMKIAGLPIADPDLFKIPEQKNIAADKLNVVLNGANYQSEAAIAYYNDGFEKVKQLKAVAETKPVTDIFQKQLEGFKAISQLMTEQVKLLETVSKGSAITGKQEEGIPPVAEQVILQNNMAPDISATSDELVNALLRIISDKTGYPTEMLELGMDMEADLGIDSIKRVEIFGAMQQAFPGITGVNPKEMAVLKTLAQIVDYLAAKTGTTAVATPAATAPTIPGDDVNELVQSLLQIVSDKTGYPAEMLELSMDMEADLGIDSIKRVEIFGAMQQAFPGITGVNPKEMAVLKTLLQIVDYLGAKINGTGEPSFTAEIKSATPEKTMVAHDQIKRFEPRLQFLPRPDKLVIEWTSNDTVVITDNGSPLLANVVDNLVNLPVNVVLLHLPESIAGKSPNTKLRKIVHISLQSISDEAIKQAFDEIAQKHGAVTGVICTSEDHQSPSFATIINDQAYIKTAFFIAKQFKLLLNRQQASTSRPFFISISQIDGYLGFKNNTNPALIQGGNTGLIKTIGLEWPDVFCRSIDIQPGMDPQAAASLIMDELTDPNREIKEVALTASTRNTIVAEEKAPDVDSLQHITVTSADVFLVTGGGKGITSTCINKLAQYSKAKFVLLGRSSVNNPEPAWANGVTDEKDLKKKIAEQLKHDGKKPAPADVQRIFQQIVSKREIEQTLATLKANDAEAIYFQADVRDKKQLEQIVQEVRSNMGEITGIIHGAGVLADKLIEQKLEQDFEQVFSVKVQGLFSLLQVLPPENLKFLLLFSSVAGFYGNQGQADYALSNEILNKLALYIARRYKQCRTISYNWGPWDAGMVSAELKKLFEEKNVFTIPPDYGAQLFVSELSSVYAANTQVVIGSGLPTPGPQIKPELRKYKIERKLKLEDNPFLNDHVIAGNAVLPAVNAVGMIADSSRQLYPGLKIAAIEDARVLKGIVFDNKISENFILELTELRKNNDEVLFEGILFSETHAGKRLMHYKTRVLLCRQLKQSPVIAVEKLYKKTAMTRGEELYKDGTLFHGPSFRGITEVLKIDDNEFIAKCFIKPVSAQVQGQFPVSDYNGFIMDVKFQGLVVWAKHLFGSASLPVKLAKGEFFKPLHFNTEYFVLFKLRNASDVMMIADVYTCDKDGNTCASMTGAEIVLSRELNELFANKKNTVAL